MKGLSIKPLKKRKNIEVESMNSDFLPNDYNKILFEKKSTPKINGNIISKIKNLLKF